jgi:hypothetical protein
MGKIKPKIFRVYSGSFLFYVVPEYESQSLVEQVGCRMVSGRTHPLFFIDNGFISGLEGPGQGFGKMEYLIILFAGVLDIKHLSILSFQVAFISDLPTAFGIEWGTVKNELVHYAIFLGVDPPVLSYPYIGLEFVVSQELRGLSTIQDHPVLPRNL